MLTRTLTSRSPYSTPEDEYIVPMYASRGLRVPVPRYRLPEESMPASVAATIISDELNLDGNPALNVASFVTTWMEPEADALMAASISKNFVDADEYPQTVEMHDRCVNILSDLFHAPGDGLATGCATVGSSEAIHLAGLAMKWRWRTRRTAKGLPADRPNLVMGANVQVCWEKFARYFDVEPRYVPLTDTRFTIGVDKALALVDECTIGVVGILGSTYTGEYEPVAELAQALDALEAEKGLDVPLHVDAASGGFVAPFLQPDLEWDFRLERVRSINTSGHKYGLVYPGVGWVIWRDAAELPEDLIFHVNYLGGDHPTFQLNFSRGAGQIVAQYYNFLRLGRSGYTGVMSSLQDTAQWLATRIGQMGDFEVLHGGTDLPVVCFRLAPERDFSVFDMSDVLRERGWIVPAYTMAPDAEDVSVLRIVVREGLSRDLAEALATDLEHTVAHLASGGRPGLVARRRHAGASSRHAAQAGEPAEPAGRPPVTDGRPAGPDGRSPAPAGQAAKAKTHGIC